MTAQIPVDETNAKSTITVLKKDQKDTPPEPQEAKPPQVAQETPPPPPPLPALAVAAPARSVPVIVETQRAESPKILPWIALAGSIVATGVGCFFAVRTGQALDEQSQLEFQINTSKSRVSIPEEFTDNQRAIYINGITSTVLISAGISGAIASSVVLAN